MAGAARDAGREVARLGLLALLAGCAAMQDPPGGPPDFTAPVLLGTTPDSGAVVPDLRDRAVFEFDEVIDERSAGGLDRLFQLSPRPEELDLSWKRSRIEIRPDGGWRPGTIYHLTLLPGIGDLSNNRTEEGAWVVFSTGGPIPETRVSGTVLNWEEHRAAPRSLIEAVLEPDSLVYVTLADSAGDFALDALPPGTYHVFAVVDGNTNGRRDRREPYDSSAITLDSTFTGTFWAFAHDTTGPALRTATRLDSATVQLEFNQKLALGDPDDAAVTVRLLPDSVPVSVAAVWEPDVHDSVQTAEAAARAAADSAARADSIAAADTVAAADTLGIAAADTLRIVAADSVTDADTTRADSVPTRGAPEELQPAARDTSRVGLLLEARPRLVDRWVVRLLAPLTPGARYVIDARAANMNGAVAESRTLLILPEAAPDTTAAADTTGGRGP